MYNMYINIPTAVTVQTLKMNDFFLIGKFKHFLSLIF